MKKTTILATLAFLTAGPAFAAGWADADVRRAAEGPEWTATTQVAKMPKPSTSNPLPMGVQAAPSNTRMSDLAAEVAGFEAQKVRHGPVVKLDDRQWEMQPTHRRYVEIGHPVEKDLPKHLVHDLHVEGHAHGAAHHGYDEDAGHHGSTVMRVYGERYEERGGDVGYAHQGQHHGGHHDHSHGHGHAPMAAHSHTEHHPNAGATPHHAIEIDVKFDQNCGSICWYETTRP